MKTIIKVFLIILFLLFTVSLSSTVDAAFSGSNGKISFYAGHSSGLGQNEIWTMDPDGTNVTRLTFTTDKNEGNTHFSSDGTQLLFNNAEDFFRMDNCCSAGSPVTNLSNSTTFQFNHSQSFSPDGTKVVFSSGRTGNFELFTMNSDGSNVVQLTNTPEDEFEPEWSPDGRYIAFDRAHACGCNGNLYILDLQTSIITSHLVGDTFTVNPDWSPDGSKIAFATAIGGSGLKIYTVNPDGTNRTLIVNEPSHGPAWSPDGNFIAYVPSGGGEAPLRIINLANSQITNTGVSADLPDWQPLSGLTPVVKEFFLHESGTNLFFDNLTPTAAVAQFSDSTSVSFSGGNLWKQIGEWISDPSLASGDLTDISDVTSWLGLKNSDDNGTNFDLKEELYVNKTLITTSINRCITGIVRNPTSAKLVFPVFNAFSPISFDSSSDILKLKTFARIGTNADDTKCPGHNSAAGLRFYYDSTSRDTGFTSTFSQ